MEWTAIVVALIGIVGSWFVRGRVEEWRQVREGLRKERRERYAQVLNPFVQLFADISKADEVTDIIRSAEYRKEVFDLMLVADDSVIRAYNQMYDLFFAAERTSNSEQQKLQTEGIRAFGKVLLAIRRSLGNRATTLSEVDLLKGIGIKDAEAWLSATADKKGLKEAVESLPTVGD